MYQTIKSAFFSLIPGSELSDHIYLGVLILIIATYCVARAWTAFSIVLMTSLIIEAIDVFVLNQAIEFALFDFLHTITVPLLVTAFIRRRG